MKTNNLTKRSFLTTIIMALTAGMFSSKTGFPAKSAPNGFVGGGSPIYIPRHGKLKGYMRENHRTDRGHGYMKYKFQ